MTKLKTALSAAALSLMVLVPSHSYADEKASTLTLNATGRAVIVPDMAILSLSVVRQAETAREALDANNKAMSGVIGAMREAGIAERDVQTSQFYIQPRYKHYPIVKNGPSHPPEIVGYDVSNALTVRVRDLSKVGDVLDTSVSLGVNSGGGITFTLSDPESALEEARKNAVERAIAKAKTLTGAAGVKLGRITHLSEQNRGRPRLQAMAHMAEGVRAKSASVPVAAGEGTYEVTVSMSWELLQ